MIKIENDYDMEQLSGGDLGLLSATSGGSGPHLNAAAFRHNGDIRAGRVLNASPPHPSAALTATPRSPS